jgi:putative addiction module component (TIGR02574 family)
MPVSMKTLGIDQLSIEERLALVEEIWESVVPSIENEPLTPEEEQILTTRIADLDANPDQFTTWEEIKRRVKNGAR